jgi:hypothetical protein
MQLYSKPKERKKREVFNGNFGQRAWMLQTGERENNIVMALHGEMVHKVIIVNLGDSARTMKNVGSAVADVVVSFHVLVTLSFVRYRT